ncbi:TetR family transcriptional regulator [Mycetocola zhadangensis]|nr:TetR family transcriptional regulator [Mycetocola zhadangensis]
MSAPLSAVARKAGVGQGSLYRHFPDRTALAVAVFDENLTQLEEFVDRPDSTIYDLLDRVIDQAVVSTALIDLIWAHSHDERVTHLGERLRGLIEREVSRARSAGDIGTHVTVDDVLLAVSMLAGVLARSDAAERRAAGSRAMTLFSLAFAPR